MRMFRFFFLSVPLRRTGLIDCVPSSGLELLFTYGIKFFFNYLSFSFFFDLFFSSRSIYEARSKSGHEYADVGYFFSNFRESECKRLDIDIRNTLPPPSGRRVVTGNIMIVKSKYSRYPFSL